MHTTGDDVDYLMATLAHFFPTADLTKNDIQATYAGLRPLVRDDSDSPYDVSREHTITSRDDGVVTIGGGKYTTYRRMADDVIEVAMKNLKLPKADRTKCMTKAAKLPGAKDMSFPDGFESAIEELISRGVAEPIARRLVNVYGERYERLSQGDLNPIIEGLPFTWSEVDNATTEEAALSLDDVLSRRLSVFFEAPNQGLECVDAVAERMAAILSWTDSERDTQIAAYRETVALSRRWQH